MRLSRAPRTSHAPSERYSQRRKLPGMKGRSFRSRSDDATRTPSPAPASAPAKQIQNAPEVSKPSPATPSAPEETSQPSSESAQEAPREATSTRASARASEAQRAAAAQRSKLLNAALQQGDIYYENGQYDNAIREYEKGLKLDPSNALLRQRIRRARTAKATEESLN